jgi:hypothetical protein
MSYFSLFPKTKFMNQDIVNLAVGVKLHDLIKDDAFALLNYAIKDGEAPDTVAFNYYSDPSYAWLVLLSNNIIDPYFEWPLSVYDFEKFINKKYGSIPAAQATTIHCEHNTKNITVSADSLTVSNGVSAGDYTAVDAYTYHDKINENRKFIKLVNSSYLPAVTEQLNNLV